MKKINFTAIKVLSFLKDGKKGYKYFIDYLHNDHKVKPFHIILPKTSAYIKVYDGQAKLMYFLIEDDDLLEKYNTIWGKVRADIKKEFDR